MSNQASNANSGRPAVATTASGSGATPFNAVEEVPPARGFFNPMPSWTPNPVNPSPSGSSSRNQGRGRYPSRTSNHSRSNSYLPRRPPQEPRLPVTLGSGGVILPNSDAELAAHRNASAEFAMESARYNEAVSTRSRSASSQSVLKQPQKEPP
jgi:hypothetical protein